MKESFSESYKNAGVDITAGYESVRLMKGSVERTFTSGVLTGIGGFGGLFAPNFGDMEEPVLVSGTDGVGTKLRIAQLMNRHDTIGIDAVAMSVNDIVCCGAKPLFFLDYIACGKNYPERIASIVSGISDGCVQAGCALIGGETAEHPDVMDPDDYDIAGFAVGVVDKKNILDNNNVKEGDIIIGFKSSGVHSNAFSLIRKIFDIKDVGAPLVERMMYSNRTLGEELLIPTKIYVKPVLKLLESVKVKSLSHITGGGFHENIPRSLPAGLTAIIAKNSYDIPPLFKLIQKRGNISEHDMYNTFNMGIGMTAVVDKADAGAAIAILGEEDVQAIIIGEVRRGERGVTLV
ncbi:MAG: phosphoribosylformylglycinamidine cyclo-ligase [Oscillospiraceae bacterium]|jgi:phosphoribosylformylglycinamidine cyclo-ligase|nr:phosphoribosylformylglycinamidine cyclo-ligase [Oscillospiraceae bacterium]